MNTIKNYYIDGLKKVTENLSGVAEEVKTADFNNMSMGGGRMAREFVKKC